MREVLSEDIRLDLTAVIVLVLKSVMILFQFVVFSFSNLWFVSCDFLLPSHLCYFAPPHTD